MLPLAGSLTPDSPETLASALTLGLASRGLPAREVHAVGTWPALDLLRIDLTGVQISPAEFSGAVKHPASGGFTAKRFELVAAPAELDGIPTEILLHANDAVFEFAPTPDGNLALQIKRAGHGELSAEVACSNLENLLRSLASRAASEHGVDVKGVKLDFTSRGPRAVSLKADVTAKMFIATATVAISGDIDLDDQLNARLSNLRFSGDGMVANLAGGFIRPQLAKLEGRVFPLMRFSLGEISLRDVQLQTGETLRLTAHFGS